MKKSLLVAALSASMIFAACGDNDNDNNNTNNGTSAKNNAKTTTGTADNNNNGTTPKDTTGKTTTGTTGNSNNGNTNNGSNGTTNNGTTNNGTTNNGTNGTTSGTTGGTTNPNPNCVESDIVGACDALCQTGCTAGTQTCIAGRINGAATDSEICVPVGAGAQGAACGQNDGCAAGLGCLGINGADQACVKYCRLPSGAPECDNGTICLSIFEGANMGVCVAPSSECTVFPDTCGAAETCVNTGAGTACVPAGPTAKGGSCDTATTSCAKGLGCSTPLNAQGMPMGTPICRTLCAAQADCHSSEVCALFQGETYGTCVPNPNP